MSFIWVFVAFTFGFISRQFGLPPLVGYLMAGFVLHANGVEADDNLTLLADLGITLMLFTIGLKVNLKELFKLKTWGSTVGHMSAWMLLLPPILTLFGVMSGAALFDVSFNTLLLIAFALSFSSTVCVIKILEDNAELKTRHSDLAVSILIIQDLAAVMFLLMATGKVPSIWALGLIPLVLFRPIISYLFQRSGHGELLPLSGFLIALGGAALFELVDLKGDLGALAAGMLLAGLPKSSELYKSLMSFKDLFLIGFFLSIGFTATPTLEMWFIALGIAAIMPLKFVLFFALFTLFNFRGRTAFLSALLLSNFSEFGLIVASLSVDSGWLSKEWLVIIALAAAMSFFLLSVMYKYAHTFYALRKSLINRFQRQKVTVSCDVDCPDDAEILVVGMGRVGLGAYQELDKEIGVKVWGVEVNESRATYVRSFGARVLVGDADDIEFWEQLPLDKVKLVMLAIPSTVEMKNILYQLKSAKYQGRISAIAQYDDEREELIRLGADVAFNYFSEVGAGFAEESLHLVK